MTESKQQMLKRVARKTEIKRQKQRQDPWPKMAIEKQFLKRVPEQHQEDGLPSTLAYLQLESPKYKDPDRHLERAEKFLMGSLMAGNYAKAITYLNWGEERTVEDVMNRKLENPEKLISNALDFARTM